MILVITLLFFDTIILVSLRLAWYKIKGVLILGGDLANMFVI
jgi:hypothetical protein